LIKKNILISGLPGIGKTTVILKLARELSDLDPVGFYTQEIREEGKRKGFKFIGLDGSEGILARIDVKSRYKVGKYSVDKEGFEDLLCSMDLLNSPSSLVLIDEIGKMECFSRIFIKTMEDLLESRKTVLATVAARGSGFIEEVKNKPDCEIVQVRIDNRDNLREELSSRIRHIFMKGIKAD
jgi:nucleoside-triphosphatase